MACPFSFNPVDQNAQRFMCSLINLPQVCPHATKVPEMLTKPAKLYKIVGDGNCLFRALSYVITGRQVYHSVGRHKILDHMRTIENQLLPHMNMSLSDYVQSSGMARERVWGTDIEIFAAASLLSTDIYVYVSAGNNFTWNKFSKSMVHGLPPQSTCSIYIQNTSGIHYDVVLGVCLNASSDTQNLYNKRKGIDCSSDTHFLSKKHVEKQCFKRKELSDTCPFPSKLSKSEPNVDMQEGHLLSEGPLSSEHSASSNKLSKKTQNLKQHQKNKCHLFRKLQGKP